MDFDRNHLLSLADRCDAGAAQLTHDADHAAEVLSTRAGGDRLDPRKWAADKLAAAAVARRYADGLRAEAAGMGEADRVPEARFRQAEKVTTAAACDGILIDGSRLAEAAMESPFASDGQRQVTAARSAAERSAIMGSGAFRYVAEEGQVPYWQLGAADEMQNVRQEGNTAADQPGRETTDPRQQGYADGHGGGPYNEALVADPAYRAGLQAGRCDAVDEELHAAAEKISPVPRPGDRVYDVGTHGYGRVQVLLGTGDTASVVPDGQDRACEVPTSRLNVVTTADQEMFLQARQPAAAADAGDDADSF